MKKTEYEVKILEIDVEKIKNKLNELGAKFVGKFDQKRYVYDFNPIKPNKWIRLRQQGDKITLTIKEIVDDTIDGTKELEIEVSNFEDTNLILNELGYKTKAYQENFRESYELDGVEIDIDSWPLIPTYLEIEGKNENEVNYMISKLGYKIEDVTSLNTYDIYLKYGIDSGNIKELKF